jgi:hypothetical protein
MNQLMARSQEAVIIAGCWENKMTIMPEYGKAADERHARAIHSYNFIQVFQRATGAECHMAACARSLTFYH